MKFFFFLLFIFLLTINSFQKYFYLEKDLKNLDFFVVNKGMNLNEISNELKNKEIISNKFLFSIWVKINSYEKKLKFGEYDFNGSFSIKKITSNLVNGNTVNRYIVIPEGFSKHQLQERLKAIFNKKPGNLNTEIPNILIANTYAYLLHHNLEDFILNIGKKSLEKIQKVWNERNKNIPIKNINEMLVMASIVEKETGKNSEKNKIAGVFMNRLKSGMRLQSDPTVIFSITKGKKFERKLSRKDLKFKSDFNTYLIKGLPPEPICIPGIDSLKAVANPYNGNFFYFVSNNDGSHLFSETYSQHLRNVKLLRIKESNENGQN